MSEVAVVGRRERTKAANRAAILAAALDVFAELGYEGAGVREVIRRTDLAPGTFYNYFPDKESVLRELLEELATQITVAAREARRAATDLDGLIESGFRAYYEVLAADPQVVTMLHRNHGTIRALFDQPAVLTGYAELEEDLRDGIASGALPAGIDVGYLSAAMIGAGFEVALTMLERDPPDVDGAVTFVTDVIVGGIERMRR